MRLEFSSKSETQARAHFGIALDCKQSKEEPLSSHHLLETSSLRFFSFNLKASARVSDEDNDDDDDGDNDDGNCDGDVRSGEEKAYVVRTMAMQQPVPIVVCLLSSNLLRSVVGPDKKNTGTTDLKTNYRPPTPWTASSASVVECDSSAARCLGFKASQNVFCF